MTGWFNFLGNAAGDASFASGLAAFIVSAQALANPDAAPVSTGATVGISILMCFAWSVINALRIDQQGACNACDVCV